MKLQCLKFKVIAQFILNKSLLSFIIVIIVVILKSEFQKSNADKTDSFDFFSPNLFKNEFGVGLSSPNLSPDSELAPPRYHISQF